MTPASREPVPGKAGARERDLRYGEAVLDCDPTMPGAPSRFPHCDPHTQPCRFLLTEIVVHQGNQPARTRMGKEEMERAVKRLRQVRRGAVADERACADALERIRKAVIEFRGNPPRFDSDADRARALWIKLNDFLNSMPHSGVLADLED